MKLINTLGYAGLLPFILLPLLYSQSLWFDNNQLLQLYQLYSALILGFMAGVLWPALHPPSDGNSHNQLALLAVSYPVLSILALALSSDYFFLLQALLFMLLRLTEYFTGANAAYSVAYRRLRNRLTLMVSASHVLLYVLLTAAP